MKITMKQLIFVAVLCLLATGCASQPSFQEQLAARPIPQTRDQINAECASIRTEIVNQQAIGDAAQTMTTMPMVFRLMTNQNVAALESRAAIIGCQTAFSTHSTQVIQEESTGQKIQQCIDVCVANTSRSPETCFDICVD